MENKCLVSFTFFICLLSQYRADLVGYRICFRQNDSSSQYQGISSTCSGYSDTNPGWSHSFRDDTGGNSKSHVYEWRIEGGDKILEEREYQLCFRETEGSTQCRGVRNTCTGWSGTPNWTLPFEDFTDGRPGGCRYSWKLVSNHSKSVNHDKCRVCFKETEGGFQCQGKKETTCSGWAPGKDPSWTLPFRDNTHWRSGGCKYQWYLDCTTKDKTFDCKKDIPC